MLEFGLVTNEKYMRTLINNKGILILKGIAP